MKNEEKNYYKVICKCGHVGRKNYVPIQFAIIAENGKEAAKIARQLPRVKHNHKDAILKVEKIDLKQFLEIKEINDSDQYLHCHSRKEQNLFCDLLNRLVEDTHNQKVEHSEEDRIHRVAYKLKKYKESTKRDWRIEAYEGCY